MSKEFYCYIISNENDRTYNGYTVDLVKRLKQHNNIIKGGARVTSNRGPWNYFFIMTSKNWNCISTAMQHEWSIKYPTRKRPRPREYNGKLGRLRSLSHVFDHMKSLGCCDIDCYVHCDYYEMMTEMTSQYEFINLYVLDDLNCYVK